MTATVNEMPLAQALIRLGMSWAQGYRAMLTGRLAGRQLANGRWVVAADSVTHLARERGQRQAEDATAA